MPKRITNIITLFILANCILITQISCKKSKSRYEQLLGSWHDSYNNGLTFNSDGTGSERLVSSGYGRIDLQWILRDNKYIVLGYSSGPSETLTITLLNDQLFDCMQEDGNFVEFTR